MAQRQLERVPRPLKHLLVIKRGELLPILLAEGQPQSNASLDGALGLVVIPELSPLLIGLLIVVDEGLEPPPKVVGVISFPW